MKTITIITALLIGFACIGQAPEKQLEIAEALLNENSGLNAKELWITTEVDLTKQQSLDLRDLFFAKEGAYEIEYNGLDIYFRYVSNIEERIIYAMLAKVKADAEIREPIIISF